MQIVLYDISMKARLLSTEAVKWELISIERIGHSFVGLFVDANRTQHKYFQIFQS